MHVFTQVSGLQKQVATARERNNRIAFVPTMGALHEGHLSLIEKAQEVADYVVVSIFVNPTQFNDPKDLEMYPRPLSSDIAKLEAIGADVLFLPSVQEIYPAELDFVVDVDFGLLTRVLEGVYRPGHFEGVIKVVYRLLEITQPDVLIMGQKDFQQVAIIRYMIQELHLPVELIANPIVREADGLALSSRNVRIDPSQRPRANSIFYILSEAKTIWHSTTPTEVNRVGVSKLEQAGFRVEYYEVVDGHTLETVEQWDQHEYLVICVAAWLGQVRLIDNMILQDVKITV
ncbi:MAG: pantoate--beta-alanine ligase [Saprospiraceae bacterium]|nr:pantoate--beta-alanine ligase [Saprospiraceae bacterium]